MKVAFKKGETVLLRKIDPSPLGPDQIRLKVTASGICGSDLHANADDDTEAPFGHEVAGEVIEVGATVRNLALGQKVVFESSTPCGRCENCRNAQQELCTDIQSFFFLNSFGMAEQMIAPAINALPCDDLNPEVATLSEPLAVAVDMVRLADISDRSNVLIMGAGPIGLMALALVKNQGARRIFFSAYRKQEARFRLVHEFGADGVIDPTNDPIERFDFGCDIDRVLATTPPGTLPSAFAAAAKGGVVVFIGIAHGDGAFCRFDANHFHFKKLQLRASFASPALYTPLALQYLREGVVNGEALISHRFPLGRIDEAMAAARDKTSAVKVIVMP